MDQMPNSNKSVFLSHGNLQSVPKYYVVNLTYSPTKRCKGSRNQPTESNLPASRAALFCSCPCWFRIQAPTRQMAAPRASPEGPRGPRGHLELDSLFLLPRYLGNLLTYYSCAEVQSIPNSSTAPPPAHSLAPMPVTALKKLGSKKDELIFSPPPPSRLSRVLIANLWALIDCDSHTTLSCPKASLSLRQSRRLPWPELACSTERITCSLPGFF